MARRFLALISGFRTLWRLRSLGILRSGTRVHDFVETRMHMAFDLPEGGGQPDQVKSPLLLADRGQQGERIYPSLADHIGGNKHFPAAGTAEAHRRGGPLVGLAEQVRKGQA